MKKCPPGIICIENITLFLLCIIISILVFFIYANSKQNITVKDQTYFNLVKESKKLSPEAESILKDIIVKVQQQTLA